MRIEPFLLERLQSRWEHHVDFNLSESGVEPLSVRELLSDLPDGVDGLLDSHLAYVQTNGSEELRARIAGLYPGSGPGGVLVTTGGAEANFLVCLRLIEPGDEVVLMLPDYMQIWGLCRGFGATVKPWRLRRDEQAGRWVVDLEALRELVSERTRMIHICNPNNPTGACLDAETLDGIAQVAADCGAWLHSDEIYRGAELQGEAETPSAWGRWERTIVTSGLSKAYGLPGLRVGWVVAPDELVDSLWAYHDYTTIAPSALSDRLATVALEPERRGRLLARTRSILRHNLPLTVKVLEEQADVFSWVLPQAGAMLYMSYDHPIPSAELAERLRVEESVLVVPGEHYGMDGYLRLGFGGEAEPLREGLTRLRSLLERLKGQDT